MTDEEKRRLESRQQSLVDLVKDLQAGDLTIEDMDRDALEALRGLLPDLSS